MVLTTDHGAVLGKRAALVYGNRETSTNLRYKFGINLKADPRQAIIIKDPAAWRAARRRGQQELHPGARGLLLRLPDALPRVRAPVPRVVPARRRLARGDGRAARDADAARSAAGRSDAAAPAHDGRCPRARRRSPSPAFLGRAALRRAATSCCSRAALGAGKTRFVQGLARGLGLSAAVEVPDLHAGPRVPRGHARTARPRPSRPLPHSPGARRSATSASTTCSSARAGRRRVGRAPVRAAARRARAHVEAPAEDAAVESRRVTVEGRGRRGAGAGRGGVDRLRAEAAPA